MPTNFISVPTVSANPGDYKLSTESNYASINSGGKQFTKGLINIGKAIKNNIDKKKEKKEEKKEEEPKYKLGSFAHQTMDPEGYEKHLEWKKQDAMNEEKAKREQEVESQRKLANIPDFSNITGTSDDLHL